MAEVLRVESRESGVVKSYRDLLVWQKSMSFVTEVYRHLESFPKQEQYGLVSQIKRSSLSIPSNIAEGSSRRSTKEFLHYINIATGSLAEVETQLQIANNLNYLDADTLKNMLGHTDEISRMLQGLYHSLEKKLHSTLNS